MSLKIIEKIPNYEKPKRPKEFVDDEKVEPVTEKQRLMSMINGSYKAPSDAHLGGLNINETTGKMDYSSAFFSNSTKRKFGKQAVSDSHKQTVDYSKMF